MSTINVTNIQHETGAGNNITLDKEGTVTFNQNITAKGHLRANPVAGAGNYVEVDYDDGIQIVTESNTKIEIKNDGTILAGKSPKKGADLGVFLDGKAGAVLACANGTDDAVFKSFKKNGEDPSITLKAGGSAKFEGDIEAGNVTFNLEPDDPNNYTSTMVDGEEEKVYSGPVLLVKDELQALRARATQQDAVIAQLVTALRSQGVTINTQES